MLSGSKMWCSLRPQGQPHADRVPHRRGLGAPRGPVDDLRAPRRRGLHDHADRDDGRARRPTSCTSTTCACPRSALLGTEGNGWIQLMAGLNYERTILAATSLGLAQRAFDDTLAYVKERKQFGRPVGSLPGAPAPARRPGHRAGPGAPAGALGGAADRRGPRADAAPGGVDGQAGRHRAGQEGARSRRCRWPAATATPPSTRWSATCAAAVVTTIYGGTSEIQRNIIAKTLGLVVGTRRWRPISPGVAPTACRHSSTAPAAGRVRAALGSARDAMQAVTRLLVAGRRPAGARRRARAPGRRGARVLRRARAWCCCRIRGRRAAAESLAASPAAGSARGTDRR